MKSFFSAPVGVVVALATVAIDQAAMVLASPEDDSASASALYYVNMYHSRSEWELAIKGKFSTQRFKYYGKEAMQPTQHEGQLTLRCDTPPGVIEGCYFDKSPDKKQKTVAYVYGNLNEESAIEIEFPSNVHAWGFDFSVDNYFHNVVMDTGDSNTDIVPKNNYSDILPLMEKDGTGFIGFVSHGNLMQPKKIRLHGNKPDSFKFGLGNLAWEALDSDGQPIAPGWEQDNNKDEYKFFINHELWERSLPRQKVYSQGMNFGYSHQFPVESGIPYPIGKLSVRCDDATPKTFGKFSCNMEGGSLNTELPTGDPFWAEINFPANVIAFGFDYKTKGQGGTRGLAEFASKSYNVDFSMPSDGEGFVGYIFNNDDMDTRFRLRNIIDNPNPANKLVVQISTVYWVTAKYHFYTDYAKWNAAVSNPMKQYFSTDVPAQSSKPIPVGEDYVVGEVKVNCLSYIVEELKPDSDQCYFQESADYNNQVVLYGQLNNYAGLELEFPTADVKAWGVEWVGTEDEALQGVSDTYFGGYCHEKPNTSSALSGFFGVVYDDETDNELEFGSYIEDEKKYMKLGLASVVWATEIKTKEGGTAY